MHQLMNENKQHPSLDRLATYLIKVPGHLDERSAEWAGGMTVKVCTDDEGMPITALAGEVDQAALHALLRRLYHLGLPLISVTCLEVK